MFLFRPINIFNLTKYIKRYKKKSKKQYNAFCYVWKKNWRKQKRLIAKKYKKFSLVLQKFRQQLRSYKRYSYKRGAKFYLNLTRIKKRQLRQLNKAIKRYNNYFKYLEKHQKNASKICLPYLHKIFFSKLNSFQLPKFNLVAFFIEKIANFKKILFSIELALVKKFISWKDKKIYSIKALKVLKLPVFFIKKTSKNQARRVKKLKKQRRPTKSTLIFSSSKTWQFFHNLKLRIIYLIQQAVKNLRYGLTWNTNLLERKTFYSILLAYGILGSFWQIYIIAFANLPSPLDLTRKDQIVSTRILDRNGKLLYRIYEDENRTLIPLSQVPEHVIQATIAIEDQDFFHHHGFSIKGIVRAFLANIKNEETIQGGSTITQQLVKNRLLSSERTYKRKIREILLSVLVEGVYSKEEILEMYLNQVPYGGATYGIEEAAWRYFNKPAKDLILAEGALLAGLPAAPSIYSPFGSNPELADARQQEVLRRMVEDGYITEAAKQAVQNQSLNFRMDAIDIEAPHFVMYVKKLLAEQFSEEALNTGGLEVRTTLDLDLQDKTQQIVTDEINALARLRVHNGAALVTNPQTGEILSMVGSKNYFDFEHDGQVNVTLRPRQPGSSIKPLTYAIAFEQGQTPSTMIEDTRITYHIVGSRPYSPQNYDGKYHGKVTIRQALASSYNIPAVKTLASVGINNMLDKADQVGISTWQDRRRFGLSLTLGGGEVIMTEMAELYGTFANAGYTVELNPILEVRNYKGEILYRNECILENTCVRSKNFSPKTAYQITSILSDNRARTQAFGPRSVLYIPGQEVSVKTGTTNNLRDNWTIGYTTDRLVAVWVGNNDNTSMSYVASGITGASPIWNNIMRLLLDENNPHTFLVPEGLIKVKICAQTGTLPCLGCPTIIEELYEAGTEPRKACNPAFFRPKPTNQDENRDQILDGVQVGR